MAWQDISSARDGEQVLTVDASGQRIVAYLFRMPEGDGFWVEAARDAYVCQPVAWQPLPVWNSAQ